MRFLGTRAVTPLNMRRMTRYIVDHVPDASVRTFALRGMRRHWVLPPSTHASRLAANLVAPGDDRDVLVTVDGHLRIGRQVLGRPASDGG